MDGAKLVRLGVTVLLAPLLALLASCGAGAKTNLSALTIDSGTLTPAFDSDVTSYEATVAPGVAELTVTATAASSAANLRVRVGAGAWEAASSGSPTSPFPLEFGSNVLEIEVTAESGKTKTYEITVERLTPGTIDATFHLGSITTAVISGGSWPLALQPDGKILVGGSFWEYDGYARVNIARLDTDGALDLSFDAGADMGGASVMALQAGGEILVAGPLARLQSDGSVDATFDTGAGVGGDTAWIDCVAVQQDGAILIGGYFDTYDGTARKNIARLDSDGSLDSSFDPGDVMTTVPVYVAYALALQPDGKILVGGNWAVSDAHGGIARLSTDGSLDTTFDPGTGANGSVRAIAVQDDGKVVIGGSFDAVDGTTRKGIARLNEDGSLDTGFDPGAGVESTLGPGTAEVRAILLQADGRIIIAGHFSSCGGVVRGNVARLNVDGSVEETFDAGSTPGTGTDWYSFVDALALQSEGKLLIGGYFWLTSGLPLVARLSVD